MDIKDNEIIKTVLIGNIQLPGLLARSKEPITPKKQSVEKMSTAGVGNVVAGTLIADLIKLIVQGDGNQPATKNDIAAMMNKLQRYQLITNLPPSPFGKLPYFDFHTNKLEYF